MNAIIISIGDELVLGQTVDTNSAWLSRQLAGIGLPVSAHVTVSDSQADIEQALRDALGRCDVLLVTGGLGPTDDDLTRQALAAVMEAPLELNEKWLTYLQDFFAKRNRPMPRSNRIQAMIPRGAQLIWNDHGTAAGIHATLWGHRPCEIFIMPGVPKEMKGMFEQYVMPRLAPKGGGACILSRTLHTFGLGESVIAEMLGDLMTRGRNPSVGTTVTGGVVSLRINARFDSRQQAQRELDQTTELCRAKLGDLIYGEDDRSLQDVVVHQLIDAKKKVTVAESCTGGLLGKMITDVPGSSACFEVGFITYSNQAKYERLGVNLEMLNVYGAVSEPVVDAMARNARRLAKADYALAISGIAGPDGGTPTKPVGMVCMALAWEAAREETCTLVRTFNFPGDREMIRDRSAKMALTILRYHLLNKPLPW